MFLRAKSIFPNTLNSKLKGGGPLYIMPFPTGTCALCCPIDLDRDVEYILYTRRNPRVGNVLSVPNPLSLRRSNFDKRHPTVVYIHGYSESAPGELGESSNAVRDESSMNSWSRITGFGASSKSRTLYILHISTYYNADLPQLVARGFDGETWPGPLVTVAAKAVETPTEQPARPPDTYLRRAEYNVILVNWVRLATLPWYHTAVENTRLVGPHVARLVGWLDAQKAVPLSKIHVVGFSLGAEVAGFMGKFLAPRRVGRITGLDAAYPLYMNTGREGHLSVSDADFVDIIHTDGGRFGFPNPIGHADFYPNGGRPPQPGCSPESQLRRGMRRIIRELITCGHYRAWMLYVESITNPLGFPASRCSKWRPEIPASCTWTPDGLMGFLCDPRTRGKFYLRTNDRPPFSRNATGYNF